MLAQRQAGRAMWQTGKPRCQASVAGWQAQVARDEVQAQESGWQAKAGRLGDRLAGPCWQARGLAGRPGWLDWPFRGPSGSGAVNTTVLAHSKRSYDRH